MNPEAMKLHGLALLDYYNGDLDAVTILQRDDGYASELPAKEFFRDAQEFPLEKTALDLCYGRTLDIGAGSGIHSLFLQERGFEVTAIDVSPEAVQVMRTRGIADVRLADIMSLKEGKFDTILMMGNGIGVVENMDGLDQYLKNLSVLLEHGGQVLLTSVDIRFTDDSKYAEYQRHNLEAGRYIGEIRLKVVYKGKEGPEFGWLHIDPDTLADHASVEKLNCEIVERLENDRYLARLTHN
ncbi:MAG: class I SAM-dependent methyltransferase [Dehalococcoidales bacterium]|nr:MAG: class I SAM-dependent methyltransferase [Dehalococcoidales bacterium]